MQPIPTRNFTIQLFDFFKHIHTIIITFFASLFEYCKKSKQYINNSLRYTGNLFYNPVNIVLIAVFRLVIFEPVGLFY